MSNRTSFTPAQPLTSHDPVLRTGQSEWPANQMRAGARTAEWQDHAPQSSHLPDRSGDQSCASSWPYPQSACFRQIKRGGSYMLHCDSPTPVYPCCFWYGLLCWCVHRAEQGSGTPRLQDACPTTERSGRAIEAGT